MARASSSSFRRSRTTGSASTYCPHGDPDADELLGTRLLFTEPDTTTSAVSQYTNSKSTTVSTAVGYGVSGGNRGLDLSYNVEQTTSVTAGTETTVTVPPVTINNGSDLRFAPASSSSSLLASVPTGSTVCRRARSGSFPRLSIQTTAKTPTSC